ncbi:GNAT family N-acetyltransferase [Staphylococcus sp. ACRSN]|uniref:GNAT family N-acetyltransferase n=1 Tax=Staphylococcus sp. ACRSN TaxID=2918214 RepID=UPI001EF308A8|nr:GNAT family N-acetyltransferase [Staphylococcus sp. ACRSN]MCG7338372.1 GNAT family N-acetyltransferase [Staphylococcus sp. ACRSN]
MLRKIYGINEVPFELLLTADPSEKHLKKSLEEGNCYVLTDKDNVIGSFIIKPLSIDSLEITNIAIVESKQNQGIGKYLIDKICKISLEMGYSTVIVATGNSSIGQLAFYQKVGFRIVDIEFDYFTRNYSKPIYENDILCRDFIKLVKFL